VRKQSADIGGRCCKLGATMDKDLTHTFVFSPLNDAPWNTVDLSDFSQRLDSAFPGAAARPEERWDRNSSRIVLSFELPWDKAWLEGLINAPGSGIGSFSISNATPHEAAVVLTWFREQYVPPSAAVVFTTSLGLENGVDDTRQITAGGDTDTLAEILGNHAEAIERSLGD
jgi:hypothetical protein